MAVRLNTAASSNTDSFSYSVSAGNNRCLIVGITQEVASPSQPTVAYGGQSMTHVVGIAVGDATDQRVDLFFLNDAGIQAASGTTIVVTGEPAAFTINAASYENCVQTTPTVTDTHASTGAGTTTLDITSSDTSVAVCLGGMGNSGTVAWSGGVTEQTEQVDVGATTTGSLADEEVTTGAAENYVGTWTTANRRAGCALILANLPAEGITGVVPSEFDMDTADVDVDGLNFGASQGSATVYLSDANTLAGSANEVDITSAVNTWSDTQVNLDLTQLSAGELASLHTLGPGQRFVIILTDASDEYGSAAITLHRPQGFQMVLGAATPGTTTQRLTGMSGTFGGGRIEETAAQNPSTTNTDVANNGNREDVWSIEAKVNSRAVQYDFRVLYDGEVADTITQTPQVTISAGENIPVGAGALTLVGHAPTASVASSIAVDAGSAAITGWAPTVSVASSIAVDDGALALVGLVPTLALSDHITRAPAEDVLAFGGLVPSIVIGVVFTPGVPVVQKLGAVDIGTFGLPLEGTFTKEGTVFPVSVPIVLDHVDFNLRKEGSPTGNLVIEVYLCNEGNSYVGYYPAYLDSPVATSTTTLDVSTLTGTLTLYTLDFAGEVLPPGIYAFVATYNDGDPDNYVETQIFFNRNPNAIGGYQQIIEYTEPDDPFSWYPSFGGWDSGTQPATSDGTEMLVFVRGLSIMGQLPRLVVTELLPVGGAGTITIEGLAPTLSDSLHPNIAVDKADLVLATYAPTLDFKDKYVFPDAAEHDFILHPQTVGFFNFIGIDSRGEVFRSPEGGILRRVDFLLAKNGGPVGTVIARLYAADTGDFDALTANPANGASPLASSTNTFDAATDISLSANTFRFDFAGYRLEPNTPYAIVVEFTGSGVGDHLTMYVWQPKTFPGYHTRGFPSGAWNQVTNTNTTMRLVVESLHISGQTPVVGINLTSISPAQDTLLFAGLAPSLLLQPSQPSEGTLVFTGFAPTVLAAPVVKPDEGILTLTGYAPDVGIIYITEPAEDTLVLTGEIPVSLVGERVRPGEDTLALTGEIPTVEISYRFAPAEDVLALTGEVPSVELDYTLSPAEDTLAFSGLAPSVGISYFLSPGVGALNITQRQPYIKPTLIGTYTTALRQQSLAQSDTVDIPEGTELVIVAVSSWNYFTAGLKREGAAVLGGKDMLDIANLPQTGSGVLNGEIVTKIGYATSIWISYLLNPAPGPQTLAYTWNSSYHISDPSWDLIYPDEVTYLFYAGMRKDGVVVRDVSYANDEVLIDLWVEVAATVDSRATDLVCGFLTSYSWVWNDYDLRPSVTENILTDEVYTGQTEISHTGPTLDRGGESGGITVGVVDAPGSTTSTMKGVADYTQLVVLSLRGANDQDRFLYGPATAVATFTGEIPTIVTTGVALTIPVDAGILGISSDVVVSEAGPSVVAPVDAALAIAGAIPTVFVSTFTLLGTVLIDQCLELILVDEATGVVPGAPVTVTKSVTVPVGTTLAIVFSAQYNAVENISVTGISLGGQALETASLDGALVVLFWGPYIAYLRSPPTGAQDLAVSYNVPISQSPHIHVAFYSGTHPTFAPRGVAFDRHGYFPGEAGSVDIASRSDDLVVAGIVGWYGFTDVAPAGSNQHVIAQANSGPRYWPFTFDGFDAYNDPHWDGYEHTYSSFIREYPPADGLSTIHNTVSGSEGFTTIAALAFPSINSTEQVFWVAPDTLAFTGEIPSLLVGEIVVPDEDTLVLTGQIPVVDVQSFDKVFEPAEDILVIAGEVPVVQAGQGAFPQPGVGTLAITGLAPSIEISYTFKPAEDTLQITGEQPTASVNLLVAPGPDTLLLVGEQPIVSQGLVYTPGAGALQLTGQQPSAEIDYTIEVPVGSLAFTGRIPVSQSGDDQTSQPDEDVLQIIGLVPSVEVSYRFTPAEDTLSLTGLTPLCTIQLYTFPGVAALAFTGQEPSNDVSYTFTPGEDTLDFTGLVPVVAIGVIRQPGEDTLALTGQQPSVGIDYVFSPANDALVFTGEVPIAQSGDDRTAQPNAGTLAITGLAPSVEISYRFVVPNDVLSISGEQPSVEIDYTIAVGEDTLALTGEIPAVNATTGVTEQPGAGVLVITGEIPVAASTENQYVAPGDGALSLSGAVSTVVVTDNRDAQPDAGVLNIVGLAPTIGVGIVRIPDNGILDLVGQTPVVARTEHQYPAPGVGTLDLTGFTPSTAGEVFASPGTDVLSIVGQEPVLFRTEGVWELPGVGTANITGQIPVLELSDSWVNFPDTGSITFAGYNPVPSTSNNLQLGPDRDILAITGQQPNIVIDHRFYPASDTLALTGQPVEIARVFKVPAGALSFVAYVPELLVTGDRKALPYVDHLRITGLAPVAYVTPVDVIVYVDMDFASDIVKGMIFADPALPVNEVTFDQYDGADPGIKQTITLSGS